jgi:hypothetical protein
MPKVKKGPPIQDTGTWISATQAKRIAGNITWFTLHHYAITGVIGTLVQPGELVRYRRSDCVRLAEANRRTPGNPHDRRRLGLGPSQHAEGEEVSPGG